MTDPTARHAIEENALQQERLCDEQLYLLAGLMLPGWGAELLLACRDAPPPADSEAAPAAAASAGGWLGRWLPGRLAA